MEFGIILPNSGSLANPRAIFEIAEAAERLGFDALWTADHLVLPIESSTYYPYMPGMEIRPDARHAFIDPMIALAGVAARTSRIRLGVSVYLAALRHPIVAAKLAASLDQLSEGRLILGVGSGWVPEEYETLGIPFPARGRVLDEHLRAMRALWQEDQPRFDGEHYRFENLGFDPKPVDRHVPIWVGGNSRPARRRAADLGDGWHVIDVPTDELRDGVADLAHLCEAAGRSIQDVTISMRAQVLLTDQPVPEEKRVFPLMGPIGFVLDVIGEYRASGLRHLALWPRESTVESYIRQMERLAHEIVEPLSQETC